MAQSDLNYVIAVKLSQLDQLQMLHDTMKAIQEVAKRGASFAVRVDAGSLEDLTNEVATAVKRGVGRAGIKIEGDVGGDNGKLEAAISRLADRVERINTGGGAPNGASNNNPSTTSASSETAARPASRASGMTRSYLQKQQDFLAWLEKQDQAGLTGTFDKTTAEAKKLQQQIAERMGRKWTEQLQRSLAGMDSSSQDSLDEVGELLSKTNMVAAVRERVRRLVERETRKVATGGSGPGSSLGGSGGLVNLAIDTKALTRAFEDGAQKIGTEIRSAMQDVAKIIAGAVRDAGSFKDYAGPVSTSDVAQMSATMRPSGMGTERAVLTRAKNELETQRTALLDTRTKAAAEIQRLTTELDTLRASRPSEDATKGLNARKAELEREINNLKANLSPEGRVQLRGSSTEPGKVDEVASRMEQALKLKERELSSVVSELRRAQQSEGDLSAQIRTRSDRIKALEQTIASSHSRERILSEQIAMTAGAAAEAAPGRPSLWSTQQMTTNALRALNNPDDLTSKRDRRAARVYGNMTDVDAVSFAQAADAGVMLIPRMLREMTSMRTMAGAVPDLQASMAAAKRQRDEYSSQASQESDIEKKAALLKLAAESQRQYEVYVEERNRAMYRNLNQEIQAESRLYRARLVEKERSGEIPFEEMRRREVTMERATQRVATLSAEKPELEQSNLLLPDALGQYIKDTINRYIAALKQYSQTGAPISESLRRDVESSNLMRRLAGALPTSAAEAEERAQALIEFNRKFTGYKTAYQSAVDGRGFNMRPRFSPDLTMDVIPEGPDDLSGIATPRLPDAETRARILEMYYRRGGGFARQSEERRAYSLGRIRQYEDFERRTGKPLSEYQERELFGFREEVLFGGRYYQTNRAPRDIVDGMLMSPDERKRFSEGGVRSGFAEYWRNAATDTTGMSAERKSATELKDAIEQVETSLARVVKTLTEMSKVNFDPVVAQFQKLGEVLTPFAATLAQVQTSLASSGPLQKSVLSVATAREREALKTAGTEQRLALGVSASEERAVNTAIAKLMYNEDLQRLKASGMDDRVAEETAKANARARARAEEAAERARIKESGAAARTAEAEATARAREAARTQGFLDRQALDAAKSVRVDRPSLAGLLDAPETLLPMSEEVDTLKQLLLRGRRQIGNSQATIQDLLQRDVALQGAGMPVDRNRAALNRATASFDGYMATFATNALALTQADPRFFGRSSDAVAQNATDVLRLSNERRELGDTFRVLKEALTQIGERSKLIAELSKSSNPAAQERVTRLRGEQDELRGMMDERYAALRASGRLGAGDPNNISAVAKKYGEVNRELAQMYDGLMKVSRASLDAEKAGGTFLDRFGAKLRNLSYYVMAGGVVYTIASQLRQAMSDAVGLEADIARIQGVLNTRSSLQAQAAGSGIMQAAMDYGVPLREALRSGKLFAQTGLGAGETVEMTRATMAATVGADLPTGQATELLIAVKNITDDQVKAMEIVDRISRIESQYAVSATDLSNAIQRAGSLAAQLQPQALGAIDALDLVIGASTEIISRTRISGEQAATSLRFIFSRLAAPEVARSLQDRFGIRLAGDDPRQLRPLQDILSDIAKTYNDLKSSGRTVEANQLLSTFAGARQSNVAAALLSGMDNVLQVAGESAMAFGDTNERVRLQLDTLQSKLQQFNTAFAGFASSVFNDTGLAALTKMLVDLATATLKAGSSGPGSLGLAAGLGAFTVGARAASGALTRYATPVAAGSMLVDASGAALGASAVARTGLVAGAARVGGGALATAAGYATPAAIILGILGAAQLFAESAKRAAEQRDIVTGKPFDRAAFESESFFSEYRGRANAYGLNTEEMFSTVEEINRRVGTKVDDEIRTGALNANQRYKRTVELFNEEFSRVLPGFSALASESEKTATALALLKESAKYGSAVPQQVVSEFMKDLENKFAAYDTAAPQLGARMRTSVADAVRLYNLTPFQDRRNDSPSILAGLKSSAIGDALGRLLPGINFNNLRLPGNQNFRQLYQTGDLTGMDQYFRQNLFLSDSDASRLQLAETTIRQRDGANAIVTSQKRYEEALKGLTNATDEQKTQLQNANRVFDNQRAVALQLVDQLKANMNFNDRVQQVRIGSTGVGQEAGDVTAEAVRQIIRQSRNEIARQMRAQTIDQGRGREITARLRGLEGSETRVANFANLTQTNAVVRDRLFEPILSFASRAVDLRAREDMATRFGLNVDVVRERSESAQQFIRDVEQVQPRILRDLIQMQARFVSTSGRDVESQLGLNLSEDENAPGRRDANVLYQFAQGLTMSTEDRARALRQMAGFSAQLETMQKSGLGGFIEQGLGSADADVRKVAENLKTSLEAYLGLANTSDATAAKALLSFAGTYQQFLEKVKETAATAIDADVGRMSRLAQADRDLERARSGGQIQLSDQQARLQAQLQLQQLSPRNRMAALQTQFQLGVVARDERIREAERVRDRALLNTETMTGQAQKDAIAAAQAAFANARDTATAEELRNRYTLVAQQNAQRMQRNRDEANQLVSDLTSPLSELLSSTKNFNREGYERMFDGVAQAAQRRLVDMFMNNMFGEATVLGEKLRMAFGSGALTTQTAIERGFNNSISRLMIALDRAMGTPTQAVGNATAAIGQTLGATGATAATGATSAYEYWQAFLSNDTRFEDLTQDQLDAIESQIAGPRAGPAVAGTAALAAAAQGLRTVNIGGQEVPLDDVANANVVVGPGKLNWKAGLGSAMPLVGSLAGGAINTGIDNSYAGQGASMGALIGNMILPGLGGLAGGLLGGLFGSRIGKGNNDADRQISSLERIEANTRQQIQAIENQTRMLTLDSRFMNVPTGFTVPGFRPFGTGGGDVNLTVNIRGSSGDPQQVANLVSDAIRQELRGLGTSYNVLNN